MMQTSPMRLQIGPMRANRRRASTLLLVLTFGILLSILAMAILKASFHNFRMADRSLRWAQAMTVAEAGVESAVHSLAWSGDWVGWDNDGGQYWKQGTLHDHQGEAMGDYRVTVIDPESEQPLVRATGYVPSMDNPIVRRTVQVEVFAAERSFFEWGIYSYGDMQFDQGFWADSYDSRQGVYPGRGNGNSKAHVGGGVGVNASLAGNTAGGDPSVVNGNLQVGGTITFVGSAIEITGETIQGDAGSPPPPFPDEALAEAQANNNNDQIQIYNRYGTLIQTGLSGTELLSGGSIVASEARIVMPPGTYYLSRIEMGRDCRIEVSPAGPVTVFLDPGTADFGVVLGQRCFVNGGGATNDAHNFQVFQTGGKINFSQSLTMYAAWYAPNSPITTAQDFDIYGAIVVDGLWFSQLEAANGYGFHYDESLGRPKPAEHALVRSWVEMPPQDN